jgi:hypothetical protein
MRRRVLVLVLVRVLGAVLVLGAVPAAAQTGTQRNRPRDVEVRAFFTAGSEKTEAPKTFDAVLGSERITLLGGGGEFIFKHRWLVRGQFSQFSGRGTRVFVDTDGTVFPLDIPLDITVRVTEFSGGYRFYVKPRWSLYGAGGRSMYSLREESNGESARSNGSGWHVLGGFDARPYKWVFVAGEAQWTKTDDILTGGAAEVLDESRLGGFRIAGRIGIAF